MDVSEVFFTSAAASTFSSKGGEGRCLNFCQCLLQSMVPHQLYQCGPDLRGITRSEFAQRVCLESVKGLACVCDATGFLSLWSWYMGTVVGKRKKKQKQQKLQSLQRYVITAGSGKEIQCLEMLHFLSILGNGGKTTQTKSPKKDVLSFSVWIVNIMPMFINPRALKRYLISKNNLVSISGKYRNGNPVTVIFLPAFVLTSLEFRHLIQDKFQTRCKVLSELELSAYSKQRSSWLFHTFIRTAFL
nr:PREDICTED: uncharacterized protein LOC103562067 isoform X2 [Equus przewalskii]